MQHFDEKPIFIRGLSRSGGTLLVTIWDAHPDVSMSYELYPNVLDSLTENYSLMRFFRTLLSNDSLLKQNYSGDKNKLKVFVARCYRSGLNSKELRNIFDNYVLTSKRPFADFDEKMEFIACCARAKMKKEGKSRWGMKCTGAYDEYLKKWPNANFINIVRDGRDVMASQLNTGSFNKNAQDIAEGYKTNHEKFLSYQELDHFKGLSIRYEDLVVDISTVSQNMCNFVELAYSLDMERYYEKDLTIYSNSMGHLSRNRINKPADATQIGRWQSDVSQDDLDKFNEVAGELLTRFGYK